MADASVTPLPLRKEEDELPISVMRAPDRLRQVEVILTDHENGQLNLSAQFADSMLRDDRINGVLSARRNGLLGAPVDFDAADGRPEAERAASLMSGDDKGYGLHTETFASTILGALTTWGLLLGVGVAEILWDWQGGMLVPRLKLWNPQFLHWDWNSNTYILTTKNGPIQLPRIDRKVTSDGHWLIYAPYGYQYGWLRGLVRPLAKLFIGRGWSYRDWLRQSEKHGQPIDKVVVPEQATLEDKKNFFRKVANRGGDAAVMVEQDADGAGFDFQLVEATGRTWEMFKDFLSMVNTDIAVTVLGQNLTTEVKEGSLAAAKVSDRVRADFLRMDAETLSSAIYHQVLTHWARLNFGDPGLAPHVRFNVDPAEDNEVESRVLVAVSQALAGFKQNGAPVDQRGLLERFNVPMLDASALPLPVVPPAAPVEAPDPVKLPTEPPSGVA